VWKSSLLDALRRWRARQLRVEPFSQRGQHATGEAETRLSGYASLRQKQTLLRNHPAKNKKPSARLLIRCILTLFPCPLHNRHSQSRMYSVSGYHGVGEGDGE
jgi:hypothetical protein